MFTLLVILCLGLIWSYYFRLRDLEKLEKLRQKIRVNESEFYRALNKADSSNIEQIKREYLDR